MVNSIVDGISIKLDQVFGSGYRIYSEKVKQGLKEPCFFIVVLNPSQTALIGRRRFRTHPIDVHYFPEEMDNNAELQDAASALYGALEWISVNGDLVRGTDMSHEVIDGVLHFFVNYNLFVYVDEVEADPMEVLTVNNDVKE